MSPNSSYVSANELDVSMRKWFRYERAMFRIRLGLQNGNLGRS